MFGWRRRGRENARAEEYAVDEDFHEQEEAAVDGGPYDREEAPDDEIERLDLGSVRLPVPENSQLQVEIDPEGPVRAVHLLTPSGRLTVSAFAAPRTGELWQEVRQELANQLRSDGATVRFEDGAWDTEIVADTPKSSLRFVGVDGPRWLLRGVAASPAADLDSCTKLLHAVMEETIVDRGSDPMPVRTPLPIELPQEIAQHIQHQQEQAQAQA
ncbi:DUF3710 domain-containing protein [Actinopolyspora mortivallis]|uniref:DUF3710 domain-containing protein n=1 Tax=Actinopolyspora mortivallis TaxID=33906 RepID=UPI00036416BC|nr:DUF3710 domain-containing protein [Actinopolyspora mortivallis]